MILLTYVTLTPPQVHPFASVRLCLPWFFVLCGQDDFTPSNFHQFVVLEQTSIYRLNPRLCCWHILCNILEEWSDMNSGIPIWVLPCFGISSGIILELYKDPVTKQREILSVSFWTGDQKRYLNHGMMKNHGVLQTVLANSLCLVSGKQPSTCGTNPYLCTERFT